ncbi:putative actinidain [Helianthus annuus]|nr:putative actinidain [Helianthus annuus]
MATCWAFAATSTIETLHHIETGILTTLSEQELIDCDQVFNSGCTAGTVDACRFIVLKGGICSDDDCPFTGTLGMCKASRVMVIFKGKTGTVKHAAVIIGYGTENGVDYWLLKNSWGPTWGETGVSEFNGMLQKLVANVGWLCAPSYL